MKIAVGQRWIKYNSLIAEVSSIKEDDVFMRVIEKKLLTSWPDYNTGEVFCFRELHYNLEIEQQHHSWKYMTGQDAPL